MLYFGTAMHKKGISCPLDETQRRTSCSDVNKSKRVARGRAEAPAVFRKPTKPVKRTHGVPLAKCMAYLLRNTWPTKLEIFDKADFCRVQQIRTQIRNIRQGCVKYLHKHCQTSHCTSQRRSIFTGDQVRFQIKKGLSKNNFE